MLNVTDVPFRAIECYIVHRGCGLRTEYILSERKNKEYIHEVEIEISRIFFRLYSFLSENDYSIFPSFL